MRAALRPSRLAGRRMASSTSSSGSNEQVQKAVQTAQSAAAQASATFKRVAGPLGGRVESALGSYGPRLRYNAQVFGSFWRQVYQAERLAPPLDAHTWTTAYSKLFHNATRASYWQGIAKSGAWAGVGIAALEAYGIFSLGEIIGRRNLVGYKLE